ncbi:PH domain-containing protein [bacterium]|nr:PH domain-containing protein [bacterium]
MAKSSTTQTSSEITLSKRAFWYFFGYHAWQVIKKFGLWTVIATAAGTSVNLIRTAKIFGMSDGELGLAFLRPAPYVAACFVTAVVLHGMIRGLISTLSTKYRLTPQGVMLELGWLTRTTTVVSFEQIQRMTIVSNPYDRLLKAAYINLDLIGGANSIQLEAIDKTSVEDLYDVLANARMQALRTVALNTLELERKLVEPEKKARKRTGYRTATEKQTTTYKKPAPKKVAKKPTAKAAPKKSPRSRAAKSKRATSRAARQSQPVST